MKNYLIIGAGFSGAVVAERLTAKEDCKVTIVDERDHIGGNCYSKRDSNTNVMIHKYGPHIFNTSNEKVWTYINQFCEMIPFINRVKTIYKDQVYSMPINLHTINQFFQKALSPKEAEKFIQKISNKEIEYPQNFEDQAMKFIGKDLYKAFFYGYTKKQWGCEPSELPASILKRLPIRFSYDDNYYSKIYQGIPKDGYTAIFEKMLSHSNIEIKLNTKFSSDFNINEYDHIYYTGPIDAFFNFRYGRLSYRTVYFERGEDIGDYQGNAVMNYADPEVPYTRIHEHKHFTPWERHEKTVYFKEYSKETNINDEPYYPKRLKEDINKLEKYQQDVEKLTNFTFLGRLATYRYLNMDQVIEESLRIIEHK